jgi:LysM repeat protein
LIHSLILSNSASQSSVSSEEKPSASETTESSSAVAGATTTVEAGEGLYSIAARTGVDAQTIAKANGMTVENWYANPGDVIKLK